MEPPPQLLNNNHLYLDLNMNFSENVKQQAAKMRKVGRVTFLLSPVDRVCWEIPDFTAACINYCQNLRVLINHRFNDY